MKVAYERPTMVIVPAFEAEDEELAYAAAKGAKTAS